jgi:integrase
MVISFPCRGAREHVRADPPESLDAGDPQQLVYAVRGVVSRASRRGRGTRGDERLGARRLPAAATSRRCLGVHATQRAAINTFVRWLVEHDQPDARQARLALSVQPPRPSDEGARRPIVALTVPEYEHLLPAEREVAHHPLLGWRDVAIVRTLGERGLRAEELCCFACATNRPTRR